MSDHHNEAELRQRLHAATGDRDAEARALADRSPDTVGFEKADVAVRRAHGDIDGASETRPDDMARPEDAAAVAEDDPDLPPKPGSPTDFDPASE